MIQGFWTAVALAAATASAPATSAQAGPATPGAALQLEKCRVDDVPFELRCGTLRVREDRSKSGGRILPLKVMIVPARSGRAAPDPVFYFEGGPGQSATDSASYVADMWISEHNDVVLVDQRGTGAGHRLDCKLPGSDADLAGYLSSPLEAYKLCAKELSRSADLRLYATPTAVQDVEEARQALGYGRINLYGGSYGSRAAMMYARFYPQHTRAMYISGVVPLELKMPLYFAWSAQRALDSKLAECAADAACRREYPDPAGDLAAIRASLERVPARVMIRHPTTGAPAEVTLTPRGLAEGLLGQLYIAGTAHSLPRLLKQMRAGDLTAFAQSAVDRVRDGRGTIARGLHRALVCNEDTSRIRPEEVAAATAGTFIGDYMVREAMEGCKAWPQANLPADYFDPFTSQTPTLITSGAFDPVTPARWGQAARKSFPNSVHIVTRFAHSGFEETGCLGKINSAFLAKGSVEGLDAACASDPAEKLSVVDPDWRDY